MTLLVTRPGDDGIKLANLLGKRGFDVIMDAMLSIEMDETAKPDLAGVQAVLATSANGIRALSARSENRELPVLAVGDATAALAREMDYATVRSASGDVESLAALAMAQFDQQDGALYHPAGSEIAGNLSKILLQNGFEYRRDILYRAEKHTSLNPVTVQHLKSGLITGALFYSPRTLKTFCELLINEKLSTTVQTVTAYCLSPAVASKCGDIKWGDIKTCSHPDQKSMLELVEVTG